MFISNPSVVDRIALKRHEPKLTVFAFVFFSIICLRYNKLSERCDNWQQQIFTHSLFQLSVAN